MIFHQKIFFITYKYIHLIKQYFCLYKNTAIVRSRYIFTNQAM